MYLSIDDYYDVREFLGLLGYYLKKDIANLKPDNYEYPDDYLETRSILVDSLSRYERVLNKYNNLMEVEK